LRISGNLTGDLPGHLVCQGNEILRAWPL
jgi:hypothetical protein